MPQQRDDAFSAYVYRMAIGLDTAGHPAFQDYEDIYEHYRDDKDDAAWLITSEIRALILWGENKAAHLLIENLVRAVRGQEMIDDTEDYPHG